MATNTEIKNKRSRLAQTVTELAVFGGVFVFVLGLIIRQGMSYSYQQNQTLKAMRMAMQMSFRFSEGLEEFALPGTGTVSRNTSTVVLVEDRLNASADKFGATD